MSLIIDISGLDYCECHLQCLWQRVTECLRLMWQKFRSHCEGKSKWTWKSSHILFTFLLFARIRLDFQIWTVRTLYCFCLNLFNGTIYLYSLNLSFYGRHHALLSKSVVSAIIPKKLVNYFQGIFWIQSFVAHIVSGKVGQRLNEVGNLLTLWAKFHSQCGGQI